MGHNHEDDRSHARHDAVAWWCACRRLAQEEDEEGNPLGPVIADMQVAGGRLAKMFTDKPTQQKQKDAVDKLEALIKLLEMRRQQQQGNQSSATPEDPAQDSIIKSGPGGSDAARRQAQRPQLGAIAGPQARANPAIDDRGLSAPLPAVARGHHQRLADEKPTADVVDQPSGPARLRADKARRQDEEPPERQQTRREGGHSMIGLHARRRATLRMAIGIGRPRVCVAQLVGAWLTPSFARAADEPAAAAAPQAVVTTVTTNGSARGSRRWPMASSTWPPIRRVRFAGRHSTDRDRQGDRRGRQFRPGLDRPRQSRSRAVGGASGGNGVQDIHLHANHLKPLVIKQIIIVCRLPSRSASGGSTRRNRPLAVGDRRDDNSTEAEFYLEPPADDSWNGRSSARLPTTTAARRKRPSPPPRHQRPAQGRARRGASKPAASDPKATTAVAEVFLADAGKLQGKVTAMDLETVTVRTSWKADVQMPLLRA